MFQFIQRNSSINYILLFVAVVLLWASGFIDPQFVSHVYDENPMVLYKPLIALQNISPIIGQLISLIFLLLNGFLIVKINHSLRLIEKRSVFFILLFVLFSASLEEYRQLNPLQPALTFLILGTASLFKMYKKERELKGAFESGFCFSLAAMFYAPAIYFFILAFVGLMVMLPFYWRQWVSILTGIILPVFIVFACAFCLDSLSSQISVWKINLFTERHEVFDKLFPILYSLFLALLFIMAVIYSYSGGLKKVIARKCYFVFLLWMALVLAVYLLSPYVGYEYLFFGLLPASIYVANYMLNIRSRIFSEILFILIILFAVLVQIFPDTVLVL
ncbi:MAG: DUF6427 family protein [Bacteroidales bacterium]|nr:DUF6427 family protein [Bacteroidales bacterium]